MNIFTRIGSQIHQKCSYSVSAYRSAISLSEFYPQSSLKLSTPPKPPSDSPDGFTGYIPIDKLDITYSRSSGPGGQNVNKVNTKVEVRFNVNSATWLNANIKSKLAEMYKNRITKDGFIIFKSDLTRSQQLNLADCLEKIRSSVRNCMVTETKPSEETQEKIRRRLEKATIERLALKRERSITKNARQAPDVGL